MQDPIVKLHINLISVFFTNRSFKYYESYVRGNGMTHSIVFVVGHRSRIKGNRNTSANAGLGFVFKLLYMLGIRDDSVVGVNAGSIAFKVYHIRSDAPA